MPDLTADRALKQRHRTMWAWGDYPRVATDLISGLGPIAVEAAGITAGQYVLDAAAGSGNAAIPAAATGARVVAADLTPELLDAGARRAKEQGVDLEWVEADVEALPFADGEFDAVVSVVGAMFAPHHRQTADELLRVCRPGGTLAMVNWTPGGFIGQMFRTMSPYATPPPPGVQAPPLWGDEDHVRELLGDRIAEVTLRRAMVAYPPGFATAADLRDYYKANYGPTIAVYRANAADPARTAALDADLEAFLAGADERTPGAPSGVWHAEYLLVVARKH